MDIKISFKKMQQIELIKDLKLNKYIYIMRKVKEYKKSEKEIKKFNKEESFQDTYILFYNMQKQCYKKTKQEKKQKSVWGKRFFIYFERLIKEQKKINKEYTQFDNEAQEKLKEILYVLAAMENISDDDLKNEKDLKKLAEEKIKISKGELYKSFATKLFATLNPNMPVWDKNVIQSLKTVLSDKSKNIINNLKYNSFDDKVNNVIEVYNEICDKKNEMLKDKEIKKEIAELKNFYIETINELKDKKLKIENIDDEEIDKLSDDDITPTKILDFFLWKKAIIENKD